MEDVPYGRILKEGWALIVVFALLGAAACWGLTHLLPVSYRATSTLMLQVESSQSSLFERNQFSLARIKTYPPLVDNQSVIDGVREDLALSPEEYSDAALREMLSAENADETVLLRIRADAPTAELARDMANSAAGHLSELLERTENEGPEARYHLELEQVLPASTPQSPESPQVMAITGLGLIGGLALGAIIAVYRTTTRRRLLTLSDVRKASGLPVLGQAARFRRSAAGDNGSAMVALQDALDNIMAVGGADRSAYMVVPASDDALDDDVLVGLLEAHTALGLKACVLDLRARPSGISGARPWTDLFDPEREAVSASHRGSDVHVGDGSVGLARTAAQIPAVLEELRKDRDVVIVVCDSRSSALQERLAAAGVAAMVSVRRNATTVTDLIVAVTRLRVMNISPLGVLMINVPHSAVENVAESWRTTDGQRCGSRDERQWSAAGLDLIDQNGVSERRRSGARAYLG